MDQIGTDNRARTSKDTRVGLWGERLGLLLCIFGAAVAVAMNFSVRSLFCDEAALAWNIETRTLVNLTSSPFELNQTAPLLYVYLLKILTLVLGSSEWVYRLPSLLAYAFLPVVVWWVARRLFQVEHPWLCAGFCANLGILLLYSNQAKPYMGEAVWSLVALSAYYEFVAKKLPWWGVAVVWVLLGLLGNPVWFVIAGCVAHGVAQGALDKNWRRLGRCLLVSGIFGGCMGLYFLIWLAPTAYGPYMQDFWAGQMLPWPVNFAATGKFIRILWEDFAVMEFGKRAWYMVPLLGISLGLTIKDKNPWGWIVWLTLGSAMGASCLNSFPVCMRLWIFAVPLCAILVFWTLERLGHRWMRWTGVALAVLAIGNMGILRYWNPKNNYWEGEEVNDSVAYIREHLQDGESVYVYVASIPGVQFKNGYGNPRMGNTSQDNVIWGGPIGENAEALEHDVATVEASGNCWLVMAHAFTRLTQEFRDRLASSGTLEIAHEFHDTPVYYYHK